MNGILPEECPTVSAVLGFGSKDTHLNCLMLAEAQHHIACSDLSSLRKTLELSKEYTDRELSFLRLSENNEN